jgi:hypothetical protein
MSLYALPGLFPPLAFNDETAASSSAASSMRKGPSSTFLASDAWRGRGSCPCDGAIKDDGPAHDASRQEHRGREIASGGRSLATPIDAKGTFIAPVVAIREARIDAARLIHSIILGTTNKPGVGGPGTLWSAPANRRTDHHHTGSGRGRVQRRSRAPPLSSSLPSDPVSSAAGEDVDDELPITLQEECMVFELVVRLENADGDCWSFETTCRLEGFLELRRELLHELQPSPPSQWQPEGQGCGACTIPPVPRVQHDEACTFEDGTAANGGDGALTCGNSGRGFVFLQALIRSYVPALEGWLRTALEHLPVSDPEQSHALSSFLRRPLGDQDDEGREALSVSSRSVLPSSSSSSSSSSLSRHPPFASVSPSQSATSFRPLDSIEEAEELEF